MGQAGSLRRVVNPPGETLDVRGLGGLTIRRRLPAFPTKILRDPRRIQGMRQVAGIVLIVVALLSLWPGALTSAPYDRQFRESPNAAISRQFPLGTDDLGRDRLARLLYGTRLSLLAAPCAALLSTVLAALVGGLAGFMGGWLDRAAVAGIDLMLSLPWLFLLIIVRAMLPLNVEPLVSVAVTFGLIGLLGWPSAARVVRAGCRTLRGSDLAIQARACGLGSARVLLKHVLPNVRPILTAQFRASIPIYILAEANLALLGLGVADPLPSWGNLLRPLESGTSPDAAAWAPLGSDVDRGELPVPDTAFRGGHAMKPVLALLAMAGAALCATTARYGGELRFCLYSEPKTFNPLLVSDTSSEAIRYMTAGVLIRVNRQTQELQPELAVSWRVVAQGKGIVFKLRPHVAFSDGTPFSADDVAYTMRTLFDAKLHVPTADAFGSGGPGVRIATPATDEVSVTFPSPVAGLERLFDQVGILSSQSPMKEMATLGPFYVAQYKPGSEVHLARNSYYWKRDSAGTAAAAYGLGAAVHPAESRYGTDPLPARRIGSDDHRLAGSSSISYRRRCQRRRATWGRRWNPK